MSGTSNIDFKQFCLKDIQNYSKDIFLKAPFDFKEEELFTISEHVNFSLNKGNENFYLELSIFSLINSERKSISIWTKEDIQGFKTLLMNLISQFS